MWTTLKLFNEVKTHLKNTTGRDSIYRIARELDVTETAVSSWKKGVVVSDENAIKIADLLKLDPVYVVACIHAERAKEKDSYPLLCEIAERVKPKKAA